MKNNFWAQSGDFSLEDVTQGNVLEKKSENQKSSLSDAVDAFFQRLDKYQTEVCFAPFDTPISCNANAGSGKTTTMIARSLNLVYRQNQDPTGLYLIAFNNKAAAELRTRWMNLHSEALGDNTPKTMKHPVFCTLHSMGYRVGTLVSEARHRNIMSESNQAKKIRVIATEVVKNKVSYSEAKRIAETINSLVSNMQLHYFAGIHIEKAPHLFSASEEVSLDDKQDKPQLVITVEPSLQEEGKPLSKKVADVCRALDFISRPSLERFIMDGDRGESVFDSVGLTSKADIEGFKAEMSVKAGVGVGDLTQIICEYYKQKYETDTLDFSDMVYWSVIYMLSNPEVLPRVWSQVQQVIVDEAQDMDTSQFAFVNLISSLTARRFLVSHVPHLSEYSDMLERKPNKSGLSFVYDPKQTLYTWRDANPMLVSNLGSFYPDSLGLNIVKNYRSPKQLVEIANLFSGGFSNLDVVHSEPFHESAKGALQINTYGTTYDEHHAVAKRIAHHLNTNNYQPEEIGILTRSNRMLELMEPALVAKRIPYRIRKSDRRFTNQQSYRFVYGVLSFMLNQKDIMSCSECLSSIGGLGAKFIEKLAESVDTFNEDKTPASKVTVVTLPYSEILGGKKQVNIFTRFMDEFLHPVIEFYMHNDVSVRDVMRKVQSLAEEVFNFKIPKGAQADFDYDPEKMGLDIDYPSFMKATAFIANMYVGLNSDDPEFAQSSEAEKFRIIYPILQAASEDDLDKNASKVTLSTVHSSKGAEFPLVYFVSIDRLTGMGEVKEEEERCCFYVAVTRATSQLVLTTAQMAPDYKGKLIPTVPNKLLREYLDCTLAYKNEAKK